MAEITIANTDWSIVNDVKDALADATVGGETLFEFVSVTTSDRQGRQCQFSAHPAAIVRYVTTRGFTSPEGVIACNIELELILATKVNSQASDESQRLEEIFRLANGARNAIGAAPPAGAADWGCGNSFSPALGFGRLEIDTTSRPPWTIAKLPVNFTCVLDGATSH